LKKIHLKKGTNIISIPSLEPKKIEEVFNSDISGAIFYRLNEKGEWIDKEKIIFVNHQFETNNFKTLKPLEILKIDLPHDIVLEWDTKFYSNTHHIFTKIEFEKGFSYEEALHLANLSYLVYKEENEIYKTLKKFYDYTEYKFYNHSPYDQNKPFENILQLIKFFDMKFVPVDLQFLRLSKYDSKNQQIIIFVFRGSEKFQDWLSNFKFYKEDFIQGNVHKGFNDEFQAFKKIIEKENLIQLKKHIPHINKITKNTKILLTGHSKGGAIATLVGCYLIELGIKKDNLEVYTFGSPPIGNKEFVEKYKNKLNIFRVINKLDPVPLISQLIDLKHLGKKIILDGRYNGHEIKDYINNLLEKIENSYTKS